MGIGVHDMNHGKPALARVPTPAWLLCVAMLIALVVNIVQFRGIDAAARHNYRALHAYDTSDVFEIAISRDNSARQRVAPFVYFGRLFPGSTVLVPTAGIDSWFDFAVSMIAFGGVELLEPVDYDPVAGLDVTKLSEHRIYASEFAPAAGSTRRVLDERVAYYASRDPSHRFIVFTPDGPPGREALLAFVDTSLIESSVLARWGVR